MIIISMEVRIMPRMGDDNKDRDDIAHCCTIFLKSSGYRNIAQGGDPIYAGVD